MSRVEFLRPSGAATWIACSGYVAMRALFPEAPDEADTEVAEEGTACHWLASEIYAGRFPQEGSLAPNGRELTEEMFDACDEYLGVINAWPNVAPVVEQTIPGDCIFPGMRGTPDAWAYDPTTRTLYLADLKFGFRFVEVFENWQLLCYVLMLLVLLNINGYDDQTLTIKMTIVQPRSTHRDGPVRTWTVTASHLRALFNQLIDAAARAMQPNAPCTPNPYCGDCPARHACTALQNSSLHALEVAYGSTPHELEPAAAGNELRMLKEASKRLEARITGLEMQAEHMLAAGLVVPGWGLEPTYARERWRDGFESQVLTLAKYFNNAPLAKPQRAITPKQARKYLGDQIVAAFSHRPSTGVRLTQITSQQLRKKLET